MILKLFEIIFDVPLVESKETEAFADTEFTVALLGILRTSFAFAAGLAVVHVLTESSRCFVVCKDLFPLFRSVLSWALIDHHPGT